MNITDVERAKLGSIYWIGDEREPRQFGVLFPDGHLNIANQDVAESIVLALSVVGQAIDETARRAAGGGDE